MVLTRTLSSSWSGKKNYTKFYVPASVIGTKEYTFLHLLFWQCHIPHSPGWPTVSSWWFLLILSNNVIQKCPWAITILQCLKHPSLGSQMPSYCILSYPTRSHVPQGPRNLMKCDFLYKLALKQAIFGLLHLMKLNSKLCLHLTSI